MFNTLSYDEKRSITKRILDTAKGVLMEEIVIYETYYANQNNKVCKTQFAVGEYDMVVSDNDKGVSRIYEIKHNKEIDNRQIVHLINIEKNKLVEYKFGHIDSRNVIYRGESTTYKDIRYLNVEEYLKQL